MHRQRRDDRVGRLVRIPPERGSSTVDGCKPQPEAAGGLSLPDQASRTEWVKRFEAQADSCSTLGSELYGRLLRIIAEDIGADGISWQVMSVGANLRFGQAGPLRLVGAAHRLALSGEAPAWGSLLPSCGGTVPSDDAVLSEAWLSLVASHGNDLILGLDKEVQTNEVARSAGLGFALASTGFESCSLIELGCSGGLNLRVDRFGLNLGDFFLGDVESVLQIAPTIRSEGVGSGNRGVGPSLRLPRITSRVGIDPFPIDATTDEGRWTLLSFVWPDQLERFERLAAALKIAADCPVSLIRSNDTADALQAALDVEGSRVVQHSIVWQYIPTGAGWEITETIESAGRNATADSPLAWVRYEPDEWNRSRAAIWLRTWPDGADRLVAHVDYHGRWLEPVPAH